MLRYYVYAYLRNNSDNGESGTPYYAMTEHIEGTTMYLTPIDQYIHIEI